MLFQKPWLYGDDAGSPDGPSYPARSQSLDKPTAGRGTLSFRFIIGNLAQLVVMDSCKADERLIPFGRRGLARKPRLYGDDAGSPDGP